MKTVQCDICKQKTDIYTKCHKTTPFIDGRNYDRVCFGCFHVPRTSNQTYKSDGGIRDHTDLDYSPKYTHNARELTDDGCCDTIREAKICVEAVRKLLLKPKKNVALKARPKPDWTVL